MVNLSQTLTTLALSAILPGIMAIGKDAQGNTYAGDEFGYIEARNRIQGWLITASPPTHFGFLKHTSKGLGKDPNYCTGTLIKGWTGANPDKKQKAHFLTSYGFL